MTDQLIIYIVTKDDDTKELICSECGPRTALVHNDNEATVICDLHAREAHGGQFATEERIF